MCCRIVSCKGVHFRSQMSNSDELQICLTMAAVIPPSRVPPILVSPSILSADFAALSDECHRVIAHGADWLHIDVMDGHFVPNLTLGPPIIGALRKHVKQAYFDVHLMVSEPARWVKDTAAAGANSYTFHYESTTEHEKVSKAIRDAGMHVGISIKPHTPADVILPLLPLIDLVLVMTVEPGFGGQKFQADMMPKIRQIRAAHPTINIEVDGGINEETAKQCADAGANVFVAGSAVFGHDEVKVISGIRRAGEQGRDKWTTTAATTRS